MVELMEKITVSDKPSETMKNIVAGLVAVALIVLGSLSFAQKHHQCRQGWVFKHWHAHALKKNHESCGSVTPSI
ncbi:hypothetical protein [Bradyrhizobium sp. LTSPM299]|jgi:hypothetical protein|uniref:hypothetical protein n=1 Tax=Bradyrhizobium sp. LTSPM299 TaxID=1619233 RepID=UPI001FD99683|nr:hypothetical protein [Bradyrhizobium sp. LTSPM299]